MRWSTQSLGSALQSEETKSTQLNRNGSCVGGRHVRGGSGSGEYGGQGTLEVPPDALCEIGLGVENMVGKVEARLGVVNEAGETWPVRLEMWACT